MPKGGIAGTGITAFVQIRAAAAPPPPPETFMDNLMIYLNYLKSEEDLLKPIIYLWERFPLITHL